MAFKNRRPKGIRAGLTFANSPLSRCCSRPGVFSCGNGIRAMKDLGLPMNRIGVHLARDGSSDEAACGKGSMAMRRCRKGVAALLAIAPAGHGTRVRCDGTIATRCPGLQCAWGIAQRGCSQPNRPLGPETQWRTGVGGVRHSPRCGHPAPGTRTPPRAALHHRQANTAVLGGETRPRSRRGCTWTGAPRGKRQHTVSRGSAHRYGRVPPENPQAQAPDAHTYPNAYTNANANPNANPNPNPNAHSDAHSDAHAYTHRDARVV